MVDLIYLCYMNHLCVISNPLYIENNSLILAVSKFWVYNISKFKLDENLDLEVCMAD